jgi:hypothetical protein
VVIEVGVTTLPAKCREAVEIKEPQASVPYFLVQGEEALCQEAAASVPKAPVTMIHVLQVRKHVLVEIKLK